MQAIANAWLQLLCKMITKVSQGALVQQTEKGNGDVIAIWPQGTKPTPCMIAASQRVLQQTSGEPHRNNPNQNLLAVPITLFDERRGALVLRLPKASEGDLQIAGQLAQWGQAFLQLLIHQQCNTGQQLLIRLLHQALVRPTLQESATAVVSELASCYGCERVSLGLLSKNGIQLLAVSHSASFDARRHELQLLRQAMEEATEQRLNLHSPPKDKESARGQILHAHDLLLQHTHLPAVHTLLLRNRNQIIGALALEETPEHPLSRQTLRLCEHLLALLSPLFAIKQQLAAGPFQQLARSCSHYLSQSLGPNHPRRKLAALVLASLTAMMFLPADYWVHGEATVEGTIKRALVAPQDGYLSTSNVRPGEQVKAGQLLAQLDDRDLRLERQKWASKLRQYNQSYDQALASFDRAQANILNAQVEQAQFQLQLLEEQLNRTRLYAPIGGYIVSDDISQSLGAPVEQGQVLFEVAPLNNYRVQLQIDERDITSVAERQPGRLVLTSLPGEKLNFRVTRITPLAESHQGRNFFRVEGELTAYSQLLRPGMTGSGKIMAGRHSLGWLWFHDILDWLRLSLWL